MARQLKTLIHTLKYVTTYKKQDEITNQIFFVDIPHKTRKLGANYYVILHLDEYEEFSRSFYTFVDAKRFALKMCNYYTGYDIYRHPQGLTSPECIETALTYSSVLPESYYTFKPKRN